MKLTYGSSVHAQRRIVLLAPLTASMPGTRFHMRPDRRHETLLADMQRLRGRLYVDDGAILPSQLTLDGRHVQDADYRAWHLLLVDDDESVCGCARYLSHSPYVPFSALGVSRSPLAFSDRWGVRFQQSVEEEIRAARREGLAYVEVGGWALKEQLRFTADALRIAMASYGLAFMLGGCLGISTVTHRHCSAAILRRIGGRPLESEGDELPSYFDPAYRCQMEVLRFDSRQLNPRYVPLARELSNYLAESPVICPSSYSATNDLVHAAVAIGLPVAAPALVEEHRR
jgi:hypothetical protein